MTRHKHASKEIEAALKFAEQQGWRVVSCGSHAWGKIYCPWNEARCRCGEFCISCVWSTPKSAHNHAQQLRRVVENCSLWQLFNTEPEGEQSWNTALH